MKKVIACISSTE